MRANSDRARGVAVHRRLDQLGLLEVGERRGDRIEEHVAGDGQQIRRARQRDDEVPHRLTRNVGVARAQLACAGRAMR